MAQFVQEYDPLVRMEQPSYLTTLHSQSYDSWEEFSAPFQVRNFSFSSITIITCRRLENLFYSKISFYYTSFI